MACVYLVIEGIEGTGKTTQAQKIVEYLRDKGYRVLHTKEPGTPHAPLTMELRNIMLNAAYDTALTPPAREFISQAIRSIHLEKVVVPAMANYDFIIQDRGILSGLAYGHACGNDPDFLFALANDVCRSAGIDDFSKLYTNVICLSGDTKKGLDRAMACKQEFEQGDAIEAKGVSFMEQVSHYMNTYSKLFPTVYVDVNGKDIGQVFNEMLDKLKLG